MRNISVDDLLYFCNNPAPLMGHESKFAKKQLVDHAKQCAKVGGWDPNKKGLGGGTVGWSIPKPVRHTPLLSSMRMKCVLLNRYEHQFALSQYADGFGLVRLLCYSFFWPIAVLIGLTFKPTGLGLSCFIFSQFVVFTGFLTAVQVALLTIYDMAKAVDRGMAIGDVHLLEKSGGKSGEWKAEE